jgi:biofilm PGA synthesis N-glycosyltransferase PgaC
MFIASAVCREPFYTVVFWFQVVFYTLAILGTLSPTTNRFKPVGIAHTFVILNLAAALAFYNFVAGRKRVWV